MRRRCFTLIELLVVIAVIALLIAISIPVLQSSKQRAKAVLCRSNIKELTVGLFMYENENQTFPYGFYSTFNEPSDGWLGDSGYDRMGWWWINFIEGFYKKSNRKTMVVSCPSKQLSNPQLTNNILCGNYGVNRSICKSSDDIQRDRDEFVGTPSRGSDMPHPAQTLLIVDSGYGIISWWHVTDVPPVTLGGTIEGTAYIPGLEINKEKDLLAGQEEDAVDGRHPNKTVNIGFADGHSGRTKANDLFVEKTEDAYMNRSPLWSPR